jgi:hypothetical protein
VARCGDYPKDGLERDHGLTANPIAHQSREVAILRPHAAVCWSRNNCTIRAVLTEHITQLQYLLQLSFANFRERRKGEVRRIPIPRTPVNSGGAAAFFAGGP